MADLEKVIDYFQAALRMKNEYGFCILPFETVEDSIELLKAQEPKPPIVKENAYGWKFFYCSSCGREFNANRKHGRVNVENFCDKCGQAVKWDG